MLAEKPVRQLLQTFIAARPGLGAKLFNVRPQSGFAPVVARGLLGRPCLSVSRRLEQSPRSRFVEPGIVARRQAKIATAIIIARFIFVDEGA